ncbi:MAG: ATPase, T2SS/T4P/T4SS family [Candidatus Diapherotrites archaeon]|nr:ATPase, T2SS/T4P/T4SS family [Candidatus Diapherotrites archaeon]
MAEILSQYGNVKITKEDTFNTYEYTGAKLSKTDEILKNLLLEELLEEKTKIIQRRRGLTKLMEELKVQLTNSKTEQTKFKEIVKEFEEEINKIEDILQKFKKKKKNATEIKIEQENQELLIKIHSEKIIDYLEDKILSFELAQEFLKELAQFLLLNGVKNAEQVSEAIVMDLIGFGKLSPLIIDDKIEEIMVDAPKKVFIIHREYGTCKTNIEFENADAINKWIYRAAYLNRRKVDDKNPFLDASLPDGSRINATLAFETPESPSITIRKFNKTPISIVDLITSNFITSEAAAMLWLCTHGYGVNPFNMLLVGGTGTGKTTFLNILISFIPLDERIVSIEDTLELDYPHQNKIRMESYLADKEFGVDLDSLLKNSLRMRPDRIIVGEVRGQEAITLFTAMNTGHKGVIGTLHATNATEALIRLGNYPMNVPANLLPQIDLIIVLERRKENKKTIRYVKEISEVLPGEKKPSVGKIYVYNEKTKTLEKEAKFVQKLEMLGEQLGKTKDDIQKDLENRQKILEHMAEKKFNFTEAQYIINHFYTEDNKEN